MAIEKVVLATTNQGKLWECQAFLANVGFEIVPMSTFMIPAAIENGHTFVENALIKARNASLHSGLPAIADDSGLLVDVLNGAPGIYSARYAGNIASNADNNAKLLAELEAVEEQRRGAYFVCVMVFLRHATDPLPIICSGIWHGKILTKPLGENGFGYDPIFWLAEQNCSAAQLSVEQKNKLSHRGQALRCLAAKLEKYILKFEGR